MKFAIEVQGLTKQYGDTFAIDRLSFHVKRGEIFGFLGPNGAGKTTTIKVLTTLIPPTQGYAKVLGYDVVTEGHQIRPRIGVVQQQPSYETLMTVEENLDLYGFLWGVAKRIRQKKIDSLLKIFGLEDVRKVRALELSIGQRRRLQVAREFIHDAELLFIDEPTVGLDPQARRTTLDYILKQAAMGVTIFFTTHILEEAEYLCNRVAIVHRGKLLAIDTTEELKNRYTEFHVIELAFEGNVQVLRELLRQFKDVHILNDLAGSPNTLRLGAREPAKVLPRLFELIHSCGLRLNHIRIKECSLEEAFLQIVGGLQRVE